MPDVVKQDGEDRVCFTSQESLRVALTPPDSMQACKLLWPSSLSSSGLMAQYLCSAPHKAVAL